MSYEDNTLFQLPEIAIAMEDIKSNKGKFYIPAIMPNITSDKATENSISNISTSNVINKYNISKSKCTVSNYIELTIPDYIRKVNICQGCTDKCKIHCDVNNLGYCTGNAYVDCDKKREIPVIKKGTKFIVVFVGGDSSKIRIIGVY